MPDDIVVYADPDGRQYVALVGETWWRWPAEAHGWRSRQRCSPEHAETCSELEYPFSMLALRLSGVEP
jgi:hypothetical protein